MRKTYRLEDFKMIDDKCFIIKGQKHDVKHIEHLAFSWINTTETVYGAKAGEYQKAILSIDLLPKTAMAIVVTERATFLGLHYAGMKDKKTEQIEILKGLYSTLSIASFEARLANYLRLYDEMGFVLYGDCKIYPKEGFVCHRKAKFEINKTFFTRYRQLIYMATLIAGKPKSVSFTVAKDPDILFAILDKICQVKWRALDEEKRATAE